jgi:polysaccharide export outer membrane protein
MKAATFTCLRLGVSLGLCVTTLFTGACTFLPSSGPSGHKIKALAGRSTGDPSYQLVPIDDQVLGALSRSNNRSAYLAAGGRDSDHLFGARGLEAFGRANPQAITLGDVVSVAIYETDAALFGPSLASGQLAVSPMTAIPPQTVDRTGEISVPYVGRVRVLGRLTREVESDIRESLRLKTADPQVVVNISQRQGGDLISVTGDVKSAARIPVSLAGTSLVDSIAAAGGAQSAPYDTMVTVTRGDSTRSDTLQEIYDKPAKNISLQPGDTIVLRKRALNFLAFGATGRVGSFPITVEDLRLSDAVAASGGPADLEANPATIFVYRLEPASLLREIGRTNLAGDGLTTPVVYQLDLHNPKGFFYANNFTVRDRDLVYYAPAGSAGVVKFMRLVNTLLAPAIGGAGAASSATILASP